jgi:hypothetical protein
MTGKPPRDTACAQHSVELRLDGFAWEALDAECARFDVGAEELLRFALLYYLADVDSGRIARDIVRSRRALERPDADRDAS